MRKHQLAAWAAVGMRTLFGRWTDDACGILMYHRVAPRTPGISPPTYNVTPERFGQQLEGLLRLGFRPWPLRRLIECHRAGEACPPRVFVVTFDDAYENVHQYAWPILRDLKIPATLFLATAYIDSDAPFPFDAWSEAGSSRVPVSSWRPLSIAQCHELAADGLIELGSHTHTHIDFRQRPAEFSKDLANSLEMLQTRFGLADATFAFPYGFVTPALVAAARQVGVLCALTTQGDLVRSSSDPFGWGRYHADQMDTAATIAVRLDGWYEALREIWRRASRPLTARSVPRAPAVATCLSKVSQP